MTAPEAAFDATTQRRDALVIANRKRTTVAKFKREVRALPREDAAEHLALMLERPLPHALDSALVYAVLMTIPRIGNGKASLILREAGINIPDRRIRDLTMRQRKMIAARVRMWWA